jgi:antitoxin component of MazEF toxin-antitoxin module
VIKKLVAIGNSQGIIIERPILDLLGIDRDTPLEVKTDGEGLHIRPLRKDRITHLRDAATRMMDAHDETFKKLAK